MTNKGWEVLGPLSTALTSLLGRQSPNEGLWFWRIPEMQPVRPTRTVRFQNKFSNTLGNQAGHSRLPAPRERLRIAAEFLGKPGLSRIKHIHPLVRYFKNRCRSQSLTGPDARTNSDNLSLDEYLNEQNQETVITSIRGSNEIRSEMMNMILCQNSLVLSPGICNHQTIIGCVGDLPIITNFRHLAPLLIEKARRWLKLHPTIQILGYLVPIHAVSLEHQSSSLIPGAALARA